MQYAPLLEADIEIMNVMRPRMVFHPLVVQPQGRVRMAWSSSVQFFSPSYLEDAARPFTSTPAFFYKLPGKGKIKEGQDADLICLDDKLNLTDLFARGNQMFGDRKLLAEGTFQ